MPSHAPFPFSQQDRMRLNRTSAGVIARSTLSTQTLLSGRLPITPELGAGDTAAKPASLSHENMLESEELRARAALEVDEPRAKAAALQTALETDQRRDLSVANGSPMSSALAARRIEALASRSPK